MEDERIGAKPVIAARSLKKYASKEPVRRKCYLCGGEMEGRYQNYPYTQCGLSNVVLIDVLVFNCTCGEIAVEIPAIATLHRFIAFEVLKKSSRLCGEEVRFLRKFVGYSAAEFADKIGTTNISISRWETGGKITKNTDRVLRLAFFVAITERDARIALGPGIEAQVSSIVEFAKRVKSFDLMSFLETICDEARRTIIKVDPMALAEFSRSEAALQGVTVKGVVQ